jgi:hypothetical protein
MSPVEVARAFCFCIRSSCSSVAAIGDVTCVCRFSPHFRTDTRHRFFQGFSFAPALLLLD